MNLIIFSVQASLILLAALTVCWIGRRQSAAWRSTILIIAIAAAAAVPLFAAAAPRLGLTFSLPQIPATFLSEVQPDTGSPLAKEVPSSAIEAPPVSLSTTSPSLESATRTIPRPRPYLWAIWLAGLAFGMSRILYGMVRLKRVEHAAEPAQAEAIETIAAETRQRYGLKRPVTILLRSHEPPVTWGVLRPKLLLPVEARQWTEERLRIVIGHEFAHVLRADWAFQMVAEIQRAIFWFNPLWWIAVRRLVEECEQAADDFALNNGIVGVDNMAYAEELLALARTFGAPRVAPAALAMARTSAIERRFEAIVNPQNRRESVTRRTAAAMGGAFTILMLGLAVCQPAESGSILPATLVASEVALPVTPNPEARATPPAPIASQVVVPTPAPAALRPTAVQLAVAAKPAPPSGNALPERDLSGRVRFDDGGTLPVGALRQFQFILTSAGGRRITQAYTNTQGVFTFRIAPGEYAVTLTPLRLGYCLKSATYGNTDLTRAPLVFKPDADDTPIQVIVTRTCPPGVPGFRVSGRVTAWPSRQVLIRPSQQGAPPRGGRGTPVLRPTLSLGAALPERPTEFFDIYAITPAPNGSFEIDGVPPGHYAISSSLAPDQPVTQFDVVAKDVSGIELNLEKAVQQVGPLGQLALLEQTIRGVIDSGDGAVPQFEIQFKAVRAGTSQTIQVSGREFSVALAEGEYRISALKLPAGYTLKSVMAGPLNVMEPFLVTSKGIADGFTGRPIPSETTIAVKLDRTPR